ncbi:DUF3596 domain-containing protein [Raoultella terrigena]|uniref:Arm DNA-binding domain-containing protein n=1 Tax=Raoultella terrigena TaxID=577 RepID=UPI00349FC51E
MKKASYPTGVENHGGSLRIWFRLKGMRVRENLGVPDTAKNRKVAGELRASVCFAIKMGTFDYASQFPESSNLKRFGYGAKDITIKTLTDKWLQLKIMEVANNSLGQYRGVIGNCVRFFGGNTLASSITQEDALNYRKDLLVGYQMLKDTHKPKKGRSAVTVNTYMTLSKTIFQFAMDNGYIEKNPFTGLSQLKKSKCEPDPLSREEFVRLIDSCPSQQTKNFWSLAFYTGMRHGEICALAWEDIDLTAGTLMVRRNRTQKSEFTLPKSHSSTDRVIQLIQPAIDVLRTQQEITRLSKQHEIEVKLREYGRSTYHLCTFVFNPNVTTKSPLPNDFYSVTSINPIWKRAVKRSGIRSRKAYQSRHTYACWSLTAGANPNFIASQMGHANAQMVYTVYGAWMADNNHAQLAILNEKLGSFAPPMPQKLSIVI